MTAPKTESPPFDLFVGDIGEHLDKVLKICKDQDWSRWVGVLTPVSSPGKAKNERAAFLKRCSRKIKAFLGCMSKGGYREVCYRQTTYHRVIDFRNPAGATARVYVFVDLDAGSVIPDELLSDFLTARGALFDGVCQCRAFAERVKSRGDVCPKAFVMHHDIQYGSEEIADCALTCFREDDRPEWVERLWSTYLVLEIPSSLRVGSTCEFPLWNTAVGRLYWDRVFKYGMRVEYPSEPNGLPFMFTLWKLQDEIVEDVWEREQERAQRELHEFLDSDAGRKAVARDLGLMEDAEDHWRTTASLRTIVDSEE